ncbi:hypothetical protein GCM10023219_23720 [Stakelama sediminis]|uniref:Flp pilus assembly protein TadG n=1 Tax=Stakelama sediminis TaxID=463200 RepID=A0A840YYS9_9SPHN|nr:TadE/TadG family type IV pilus assembly protein [Stakelama sediminis]MBB5718951.1 Flp pilus assembly protein TadG [Stakelama sediminis]
MKKPSKRKTAEKRGFLAMLARDVRGNTLALMAAAMIPLIGMIGGGIDLSRMYLVKTRLQHACDAGALAGRKAMGGGTWSYANNYADTTAKQFFDDNMPGNAYGATNVTRSFSENAGKVTGTASATVPMTLMRVFGLTTEDLSVNCDAQMSLPNTDVMFVLDVTGSMNCVAGDPTCSNNGNVPAPGSKIDGLKTAVKCFYEIVAKEDTDAVCPTGTPSGGLSSDIQVRFGFMPYATNVNVGKLLPTKYFADSWDYQSRKQVGTNWTDWIYTGWNYGSCNTPKNDSDHKYKGVDGGWYCQNYRQDKMPQWQYKQQSVDVSLLKNGSSWNNSFQWPINDDGSNRTITWDGCIENGQDDLNIDLVPSTSQEMWGMALPQLIYARQVTSSWNQLDDKTDVTTTNYYNNVPYSCPTQAKKLQEWPDATAFDSYVDSLKAEGNTYHDVGLLWGGRFESPKGIFASENAVTKTGGTIQRNMIFMTDGDTNAQYNDYAAQGMNWFDNRPAGKNSPPSNTDLNNEVNSNFAQICTNVKNDNITLWVISFGGGTNTATENRLKACASSGKYYTAANSAALLQTFKQIADQISQLRLTK